MMDVTLTETVVTVATEGAQGATDTTPACYGREVPIEAMRLCATCAIRFACLDAFDAVTARLLPVAWPTPVLNGNGKH